MNLRLPFSCPFPTGSLLSSSVLSPLGIQTAFLSSDRGLDICLLSPPVRSALSGSLNRSPRLRPTDVGDSDWSMSGTSISEGFRGKDYAAQR